MALKTCNIRLCSNIYFVFIFIEFFWKSCLHWLLLAYHQIQYFSFLICTLHFLALIIFIQFLYWLTIFIETYGRFLKFTLGSQSLKSNRMRLHIRMGIDFNLFDLLTARLTLNFELLFLVPENRFSFIIVMLAIEIIFDGYMVVIICIFHYCLQSILPAAFAYYGP